MPNPNDIVNPAGGNPFYLRLPPDFRQGALVRGDLDHAMFMQAVHEVRDNPFVAPIPQFANAIPVHERIMVQDVPMPPLKPNHYYYDFEGEQFQVHEKFNFITQDDQGTVIAWSDKPAKIGKRWVGHLENSYKVLAKGNPFAVVCQEL